MTPEMALWSAIQTRLKTDGTVAGYVGAKVVDEVASDRTPVQPPYIYLGPVNRQWFEAVADVSCGRIWTIRMRLFAESTKFNRQQAWDIASAVADSLDGFTPSLTSPYVSVGYLRGVQLGDVIDPPTPKSVFIDVSAVVQRG